MEESFAFISLNTQPQNLEKVQRALQKIPEVITADTVFSPCDVIHSVNAENRTDLEQIVSNIQKKIPEIEDTLTTIVAIT